MSTPTLFARLCRTNDSARGRMLTYLVAERDMARGGIVRARVAARPGACVVYVEHVCLRWARDRGATRGDAMGHGGRTGGARPDAERGAHRARGRSSCRPHDSSLADVPTRVCMADAVEWRAEIRVRGAGQLRVGEGGWRVCWLLLRSVSCLECLDWPHCPWLGCT